jgi:hypothetical protein
MGRLKVDFGQLNLGSGVYLVKVVVYDRDMIHPYAARSKDILRVEAHNGRPLTQAVFLPEVQWEFEQRINDLSRKLIN